jgi:hypothetical protein
MTNADEIERILSGWLNELPRDGKVHQFRDRYYWHAVDEIIFNQPDFAWKVIIRYCKTETFEWADEIFSVGHLESFLHLYGKEYEKTISDMANSNEKFRKLLKYTR